MSIKSHTKIQSIVKCVFKDDDPRIPLIEKSGFGWVRNIKPFHLDTDLISFLYSKHTKTCFELAEGKKFMISLEDVAHLTGLCIAGKQIVWKEDKNSDALCEKHLGKVPNKEDKVRCDVSLSWLVTIFNDFNSIDMPSEIEVERSARAFILLALGAIIFPNGASSVSPILLTFLVDFDVIKEYQWGAAMLVHTNLSFENKSLIGNMWLVQFWAYECFPELRPKHVEESWFDTLRDAPLMTYWCAKLEEKSLGRKKSQREKFDGLVAGPGIKFSKMKNVSFPESLGYLVRQVKQVNDQPAYENGVQLAYGPKSFVYRTCLCPFQFKGEVSTVDTPRTGSAFKSAKHRKSRAGPQTGHEWVHPALIMNLAEAWADEEPNVPAEEEAVPPDEGGRGQRHKCMATTVSGRRCRILASKDSNFCHKHLP